MTKRRRRLVKDKPRRADGESQRKPTRSEGSETPSELPDAGRGARIRKKIRIKSRTKTRTVKNSKSANPQKSAGKRSRRLRIKQLSLVALRSLRTAWSLSKKSLRLLLALITRLLVRIKLWWGNRQFRCLLRSTPSLVMCGLSTFVLLAHLAADKTDAVQHYRARARAALNKEDYRTAKLCYERLSQFGVEDNLSLFNLAYAANEIGDSEQTATILERIAPDDRAVYAKAHFWRAQRILASHFLGTKRLARVELHLKHVLKRDATHIQAHLGLARLYKTARHFKNAIQHYLPICGEVPQIYLELAKCYALDGQSERATFYGELAESYFTFESSQNQTSIRLRLRRAESIMFLDRYPESIDILKQTILMSDTKQVRRALAMVYVNWSDSLDLEDIVDVAQKYTLLEQGLRVYPNEPLIFDRLMRILQSEDGDVAKKQLVELLTRGHAQALVHLLLGTLAGVEGDSKQAIFHLERANDIEPNTPIVMNNLAWHMSQTESGNLGAALKLSNLV
ncbi:MAG: hypothetical protein ABGZ17_15785, partial [Planctomycetaceae bacterium]